MKWPQPRKQTPLQDARGRVFFYTWFSAKLTLITVLLYVVASDDELRASVSPDLFEKVAILFGVVLVVLYGSDAVFAWRKYLHLRREAGH